MHLYKTAEGDNVKQMRNSEKTCCYNFAYTTGASEPDWFTQDTQREKKKKKRYTKEESTARPVDSL